MKMKELREQRRLTQKQVAELLEISRSSYAKYEAEKRELPAEVLIKLVRFYKTSADYIVGLTDDPRPYPSAEDKRD